MAITKSTLAKNAACNAIVDLIDQGSLYPNGHLGIYTADSTLIAALPLSNPAFMDSTDGTSVASIITDSTAMIDGTAAFFRFLDRDGTNIYNGTVSTIGGFGDLEINSVSIPNDTTISISSAIFIVP